MSTIKANMLYKLRARLRQWEQVSDNSRTIPRETRDKVIADLRAEIAALEARDD